MLLSSKIKYVGAKHLVTGVDSFLWCSNTKTKVYVRCQLVRRSTRSTSPFFYT